jgi:hypothetical protein
LSRKRALLIGNGKYDAGLPPLAKPDADIEALARVLKEPTIGGFDEVTPLLDFESGKVRREIDHFFAGCGHDDLLLFYFSGHGLRSEWGDLYLAVRDTEPKHLLGTAIPAADITLQMDRCRSRRQVLILDCCYSGAFDRGAKGGAASPAVAFEGNGLGRVVLTASDSTQLAWEESSADNCAETSVFTRHLIHGLERGEADLDGDGVITVDELYEYVYKRVVEENPRQTPGKWSYKQQGEIVLTRNPLGPRRLPELPAELRQAMDSPLAAVREGAVRELARFLHGSHAGLAEAARKAVEDAREDDSRRVASAAAEVLAAAPGARVAALSFTPAVVPPTIQTSPPKVSEELAEAKTWPLILADNFDTEPASASSSFNTLNIDDQLGTRSGFVGAGVLSISFTVKKGDGAFSTTLATSPQVTDFYLKVELKQSRGPNNADAGLVFRCQADGVRRYGFLINQNSYQLVVFTDQWYILKPWTPSAAIRAGQTNSLAVLAKGRDLALYINDQKVDQISDAKLASGSVGLGIEAYGKELVTFDFDNFELRGSPQSRKKSSFFLVLSLILFILWALGFFAFHVAGGLIHFLLVISIFSIITYLAQRRSSQ